MKREKGDQTKFASLSLSHHARSSKKDGISNRKGSIETVAVTNCPCEGGEGKKVGLIFNRYGTAPDRARRKFLSKKPGKILRNVPDEGGGGRQIEKEGVVCVAFLEEKINNNNLVLLKEGESKGGAEKGSSWGRR